MGEPSDARQDHGDRECPDARDQPQQLPATRDASAPHDPCDASATDAAAPRSSLWRKALRVLPWLSLGVGVVSALMMDRGPDRAWMYTVAAVGVWIALVTLQWLSRTSDGELGRLRRALLGAARFSSLMATQSLVQLTLFFALPFFVQAATFDAGHAVFLLLLTALALASLWDPWTEWALGHPAASAVLPAAGSFAALTAVLPGLGISTQVSLWIAALVAAGGVPVLAAARVDPERRKRTALLAGLAALALPIGLYLGAARIVPAAPLRLVKGEMGVERTGKWIAEPVKHLESAPPRLICATAIYSPMGLHDRLFHVWRKDGKRRARVELEIVGGRTEGYRTQSRISHLGERETGTFSCTVETATGQVLGTRKVTIGGDAPWF